MKLIYPLKNKIYNFSSTPVKIVDFDPVDLFIEVASDEDEDQSEYVLRFLDGLGESKSEALSEIKEALDEWKTYSPKFLDENIAKKGALIVENILKSNKLI